MEQLQARTAAFIELEDRFGAHNYHPLDVVLERGEGVWVTDVDGKSYMDFLSAYSAVNQGHAHPAIARAMTEQMQKITLTSRAFRNDQLGPFYEELCTFTGFPMVLPMNSGAEAVETALKAARKWGYQVKDVPENAAEIIVCDNNFSGRTISIISFSTEAQYRDGYAPYTPGFISIPFGDVAALEAAITPNTVAFLFEPIQGEGGINIPPDGYLKQVRQLCTQHNVLMIADEIQTGLGRTGRRFAIDHEAIEADVITIGKALSGGFYPVSAVVARADVLGVFNPGDHGSTFGGNPLACAVARAALRVLHDENLIENAAAMGAYLMDQLRQIDSPHIKEVRGRGLLVGIELNDSAGGARRFCEALQHEGVLCKETHQTIIRLAPPLVIDQEEIDWALERIKRVLLMP